MKEGEGKGEGNEKTGGDKERRDGDRVRHITGDAVFSSLSPTSSFILCRPCLLVSCFLHLLSLLNPQLIPTLPYLYTNIIWDVR